MWSVSGSHIFLTVVSLISMMSAKFLPLKPLSPTLQSVFYGKVFWSNSNIPFLSSSALSVSSSDSTGMPDFLSSQSSPSVCCLASGWQEPLYTFLSLNTYPPC